MIIYYWNLLEILQIVIFHEITLVVEVQRFTLQAYLMQRKAYIRSHLKLGMDQVVMML